MARMVSQAAFTLSGTLAQGLVRLVVPIIVGRFAGPEPLAHVGLTLSVCVLLSMAWPTPAGTAASRFAAGDSTKARTALSTLAKTTVLGLLVVLVAAAVVVGTMTGDVLLGITAGVVTVTYSAYFFGRGVLLGQFRARTLAAWEVAAAVVTLVLTLGALHFGWWQGALIGLAAGYVVVAGVAWPWRASLRAPLDRSVVAFTAQNAVANAASNGMVQLAMLVSYALEPSTETALFAAAFSLATPASMFGQAINQVLIPNLAGSRPNSQESKRGLVAGYLKLAALTTVPFAVVWALSAPAILILFGDGYAGAVAVMRNLVLAMFLFTLALYPAAALTAWGHAHTLVVTNLVALALGLSAMWILTSHLHSRGTSLGLCVGTAVMAVLTTGFAIRHGLRNENATPEPRVASVD